MPIDKSKIPYDKIDPGIKKVIERLNSLEFCATTCCCQGHVTMMYKGSPKKRHYKYTSDLYIGFEVYDVVRFLKLMEHLQSGFYLAVNWWMIISREYTFDKIPGYPPIPSERWSLRINPAGNKRERVEGFLKASHRWLHHKSLTAIELFK